MRRGFTLIELLVVISLIGILATAGIFSFEASFKNARDGKRKADLEQIRSALELYKSTNDVYPPSDKASDPVPHSDGYLSGWSDLNHSSTPVSNGLFSGGFLKTIPIEPKDNNNNPACGTTTKDFGYFYRNTSAGNIGSTGYELVVGLESQTITNCFLPLSVCGVNKPVEVGCFITTNP